MPDTTNLLKLPTIGLIDSGIGGLHILKALYEKIPAHYIYRADTANMPYGSKTKEEIINFGMTALRALNSYKPDCIIIACHTLSAYMPLSDLSSNLQIPLVGMIDIVTQAALNATRTERIGIIATPATIASTAHQEALHSKNSRVICINQPCPTLASTIERNPTDPQLLNSLTAYLHPIKEQGIDTLILGCTHYEAVTHLIQELVGPFIQLISASAAIFQGLPTDLLTSVEDCSQAVATRSLTLIATGDVSSFEHSARTIIPYNTKYILKQENY